MLKEALDEEDISEEEEEEQLYHVVVESDNDEEDEDNEEMAKVLDSADAKSGPGGVKILPKAKKKKCKFSSYEDLFFIFIFIYFYLFLNLLERY